MPAIYAKAGMSFAYPENWLLEQSVVKDLYPQVSVASPSTASWSLCAYPRDLDGLELVDEAVAAYKKEYTNVDVEEISEQVETTLLDGFEVSFFYLDLLVRVRVQMFENEDHTYILIYQAEDREYETMALVFQAITTSLLRGDALESLPEQKPVVEDCAL